MVGVGLKSLHMSNMRVLHFEMLGVIEELKILFICSNVSTIPSCKMYI